MALHEYDMKKILLFLLAVLLFFSAVGGVTGSIYFYKKYQAAQKVLGETIPSDVKTLIEKVGRLIKLPEGEVPTVATVSDLDQLRDQPFFANAKPGDKVLVYPGAKKAILYDPIADKIVEVGPVNFPTPTDNNQQLKIGLYNGTDTSGLTNQLEKDLQNGKIDDFKITAREYTQKLNYANTLVIDLTGENKQSADEIAGILDAKIGKLPAGEIDPNKTAEGEKTDIVIIIGADYQLKSGQKITPTSAPIPSPAPTVSETTPSPTPTPS